MSNDFWPCMRSMAWFIHEHIDFFLNKTLDYVLVQMSAQEKMINKGTNAQVLHLCVGISVIWISVPTTWAKHIWTWVPLGRIQCACICMICKVYTFGYDTFSVNTERSDTKINVYKLKHQQDHEVICRDGAKQSFITLLSLFWTFCTSLEFFLSTTTTTFQ